MGDDDGEGNEETLHVHHAFFVHFFAIAARPRSKTA